MENLQQLVAHKLIRMKAFSIQVQNPFTWGNGWKSPVYMDDRKILSYPSIRNFFKIELSRLIAEQYPDADVIAGIATTAIAHGVLVAEQLGLPFIYVHPTPKDHGMENQIEGDLRPRQKVVIIENQVNVGKNAEKVIEAIRNCGCTVEAVVTIFDYDLPQAKRRFSQLGVPLLSLTSFNICKKYALEHGTTSAEVTEQLEIWHKDPIHWNKK